MTEKAAREEVVLQYSLSSSHSVQAADQNSKSEWDDPFLNC